MFIVCKRECVLVVFELMTSFYWFQSVLFSQLKNFMPLCLLPSHICGWRLYVFMLCIHVYECACLLGQRHSPNSLPSASSFTIICEIIKLTAVTNVGLSRVFVIMFILAIYQFVSFADTLCCSLFSVVRFLASFDRILGLVILCLLVLLPSWPTNIDIMVC